MGEVVFNLGLYKVTIIKDHPSQGKTIVGERFFDTEQEARKFAEQRTIPDEYITASYIRIQ